MDVRGFAGMRRPHFFDDVIPHHPCHIFGSQSVPLLPAAPQSAAAAEIICTLLCAVYLTVSPSPFAPWLNCDMTLEWCPLNGNQELGSVFSKTNPGIQPTRHTVHKQQSHIAVRETVIAFSLFCVPAHEILYDGRICTDLCPCTQCECFHSFKE